MDFSNIFSSVIDKFAPTSEDNHLKMADEQVHPAEALADEIKSSKIKPNQIDHIFELVSTGKALPGTKQFIDALGLGAEQNGIIPSNRLGPFAGLRDAFSPKAQEIIQQQQMAHKIGALVLDATLKAKAAQYEQMLSAPRTMGEVQQAGLGSVIQPLASQRFSKAPYNPDIYPEGLNATPPVNPDAELVPFQRSLAGTAVAGLGSGHMMMTKDGIVPTTFANHAVSTKSAEAQTKLSQPIRDILASQGLEPTPENITRARAIHLAETEKTKPIDSENRISTAMFGTAYNALDPKGVVTPEDSARLKQAGYEVPEGLTHTQAVDKVIYDRQANLAGIQATGRINAQLDAPAEQKDISDHYDREAFVKSGRLVQAKGPLKERDLRSSKYLYISAKDRDSLTAVDQASEALTTVHDMASHMFKAKTPADAIGQAAGYYASANPITRVFKPGSDPAVYQDSLKALANNLARAFGGERGVLTNVDVERWVNALPKPTDTAEIVAKKGAIAHKLYMAAQRAQRRAIAGDTDATDKQQISGLLNDLGKVAESGARARIQALRAEGKSRDEIKEIMTKEGY